MLPQKKTPRKLDPKTLTVLIYGRPKIGKSSLAAEFGENTLFLALEEGLAGLEVYQLRVLAWQDFVGAIRELAKGEHSFTTVVIDVVDELRPLCLRYVEERDGLSTEKPSQSARAYGKANRYIEDALRTLQLCGVGIVFLSHEKTHQVDSSGNIVGAFDKPSGPVREKVFPSVSARTRDCVLGMSDVILRYSFDDATGKRVLQSRPSPNVEAGERFNILPAIIDAGSSAAEAHEALLAPFRAAWKTEQEPAE